MKIGLYGGTFDPIHLGHLILAETVREQLELDEIWFIPAFQNPLKVNRPVTPPKARLEMLRFAMAGNPHFRLNEMEIKRKGPSYTFETLQKIQAERPVDELFLLIGADSLRDFPNWREYELIQQIARVVVVNRAREQPIVPDVLDSQKIDLLQMPSIEISATEIRQRCKTNRSIRYLTPRAVELFIAANNLYSTADEAPTGS